MKKYKNYNFDQFVTDSDFIRWVLSPDIESDKIWNQIIIQFPEKKDTINEVENPLKLTTLLRFKLTTCAGVN